MIYQPFKIPPPRQPRVSLPSQIYYLQMLAAFADDCIAEVRYWWRRFWRALQKEVQIIPYDRKAVAA